MVEELGEERCAELLSTYSCPYNVDVDRFLKSKSYAIEFAKQGISQTFLVYASYQRENVLCGYFTIASKYIVVNNKHISRTLGRKIRKFAIPTQRNDNLVVVAPLIAQLGKNYSMEYNKLISGDELLKIAIEKVQEGQRILGGKIVYLECEDKPSL